MLKPAFHAHEESRLEALRHLDLLDSLAEERYDRITRLAKHLFRVPIALVSLVDRDRQWFKSAQGLDVSETPRDISFCGHAILIEDPLIIEDAVCDGRFRDNPLVVDEPKIRFYAGHPLKNFSGLPMGTLCLIDRIPRKFSQEEQQVLSDLAALVESEFNKDAVRHFGLDKIINVTPLGLGVADRHLKIVYANRRLEIEFEYNSGELIGMALGRLLPDRLRESFNRWAAAFFRESQASPLKAHRDLLGFKKNGVEFPAEMGLSTLKTDAGVFVVASVFDITARKAAERKIEELIQAKSNFISTVTHELRTPLTSIKESIELIQEEAVRPLSARQKNFLGIAERNLDRLTGLINSVLDYQKLNAGKMTLDFKLNDLSRAVDEVVKSLQIQARKKNLSINTRLGAGIGPIYFDYDRIVQVIFNLVHNAIKFTQEGAVVITTTQDRGAVKLYVCDSGIGMRDQDREKLFQPFGQGGGASQRRMGGTGLGLAICKSILEAHGGQIGFDSIEGEGACFWFLLPTGRGGRPSASQNKASLRKLNSGRQNLAGGCFLKQKRHEGGGGERGPRQR